VGVGGYIKHIRRLFMKKFFKTFGIIAMVAVMGFTQAGCVTVETPNINSIQSIVDHRVLGSFTLDDRNFITIFHNTSSRNPRGWPVILVRDGENIPVTVTIEAYVTETGINARPPGFIRLRPNELFGLGQNFRILVWNPMVGLHSQPILRFRVQSNGNVNSLREMRMVSLGQGQFREESRNIRWQATESFLVVTNIPSRYNGQFAEFVSNREPVTQNNNPAEETIMAG
jgi:hypothetical protein